MYCTLLQQNVCVRHGEPIHTFCCTNCAKNLSTVGYICSEFGLMSVQYIVDYTVIYILYVMNVELKIRT